MLFKIPIGTYWLNEKASPSRYGGNGHNCQYTLRPSLHLQPSPGYLLPWRLYLSRGLNFFIDKIEREWNKPSVEITLEGVLSSKDILQIEKTFNLQAVNPSLAVEETKWQPIVVKGKKAPATSVVVKARVDEQIFHFQWPYSDTKIDPEKITFKQTRSTVDINPEDEIQLLLWRALRTKDKERFYFIADSMVPIELGPDLDPIKIDIWFISKDGQLNEKPFRFLFHTTSWDKLGLEMVKG